MNGGNSRLGWMFGEGWVFGKGRRAQEGWMGDGVCGEEGGGRVCI